MKTIHLFSSGSCQNTLLIKAVQLARKPGPGNVDDRELYTTINLYSAVNRLLNPLAKRYPACVRGLYLQTPRYWMHVSILCWVVLHKYACTLTFCEVGGRGEGGVWFSQYYIYLSCSFTTVV